MSNSDFVGVCCILMVFFGMIIADFIRAIRNLNNNSEWIILPDENNDDIIKSYTYICNKCHMVIKDKNYKHCPGCGRFMCNYKEKE